MRWPVMEMSLRVKLVLSYLGVALGAILLLVVVISLAVQNYFYSVQIGQLRSDAEITAQQVGLAYQHSSESWAFVVQTRVETFNPNLLFVVDSNQRPQITHLPPFTNVSAADLQTVNQSLVQALQGQESNGSLQGSSTDSTFFSGFYVSVPVFDGGNPGGKVVGALLLAQPYKYPQGFAPGDVLGALDTVILITGAAIALLVIVFSVFMTRRLTHPLVSLTATAEQVKGGDYSQRVKTPQTKDEIGTLAQTFNDMADKIETDMTELRRQDQLRRDMIANIAHDLVTPLTAIQGFSEAIADEVIADPQARYETAQLIGREVQRLRRLVSDMQNMTALETGRMQFDRAPLNVRALVDEVLAVIGPECEQAGITLRNEIPAHLPPALADSDRITQVLLNLLDNARHYTPAGGAISVGAKLEADAHSTKWLEISVQDNGSGIAAADLPFIFDRFFRIDRSRTGSRAAHGIHGGSGLGLAIVKAIVTGHGGSVRAESEPGKGTRISFTLPVAESQAIFKT